MKIMQDFYVMVGGKKNTIQFSLDIQNLANLISNEWGHAQAFNQSILLVNSNSSSLVPGGTVKPTYRLNPYNNTMLTKTFNDVISYASTYSLRFGVRYIFN
jgi:hypothetical protein